MLAAPSKTQKVVNHPSLPYAQLPEFFRRIQTMPGVGAVALQFLILTACRTSEVLGAGWGELSQLDQSDQSGQGKPTQAVWTIPESRMKAAKEHRVPLSGAAVAVLGTCERAGPYIFSNSISGDRPMSNMALAMLLRRVVTDPKAKPITVHGFRSTFRNWAAEQTSYPREVCEHALAHQLPDKVEAAYFRSDLLDKRRALMEDWAGFCLGGGATNA